MAVSLVDLSIRGGGDSQVCQDSVRVTEAGVSVLDMCGELGAVREVTSEGREVEVRMETQSSGQHLYPRRGMLLRYSPLGCPRLRPPADGLILARNRSHATLACRQGHVFLSSLATEKTLACRWNTVTLA